MDEAAQVMGYVLRTLCIPRWPSYFVVSATKVAQEVEAIFRLKENLKPSNFINDVNLRNSKLDLVEGPQVAFATNSSTIIPSSISDAIIKAAEGLACHSNVV